MEINERILNDSHFIKDFDLCQLRLIKDELDWFLLIPRVENISEIYELKEQDQEVLIKEMNSVALQVKEHGDFDKLNIGSLGNIVSQLHIHIIARKKTDRAWPGPIWGTQPEVEFDPLRVKFWREKFIKKT